MSRVRIVGGGLTGILAAFQAHALGARDIELHERLEQIGGGALSAERHGIELRETCIHFGPKGDPVRDMLESHGVPFDEFEPAFGSVSPSDAGPPTYTPGLAGPALATDEITLTPTGGASLADRIVAYPADLRAPLARYARWHLDRDPRELHAGAAAPLGIEQVLPLGVEPAKLAEARRTSHIAAALFAAPSGGWGARESEVIALPSGGFPGFLRRCHRALRQIGVRVHENSLVSPRQAIAEHRRGDALVWASNPTLLFKAMDLEPPAQQPKAITSYVFAGRWTGARPFHVQNYTAEGTCFRVYIYESSNRTLVSVECVAETSGTDLRYDIHRLMRGFEGDLALGEQLHTATKPHWGYHTLETVSRMTDLRRALTQKLGDGFVSGAWELHDRTRRFEAVGAELAAALGADGRRATIAA